MSKLSIQIIFPVLSIIIFFFNPSIGLILLSVSSGFLIWTIGKRKIKVITPIAVFSTFAVYLLLNDFTIKSQADLIIHRIFLYHEKNKSVPKSLSELSYLSGVSSLSNIEYQYKSDDRYSCQWKLRLTNIWGTTYFYCDKCGEYEVEKNTKSAYHWNAFYCHH